MAEENFGVIEASKSYTHHGIARVLGVADSSGRCSQFVLNRLLKDKVPFRKVGNLYFINGQCFNLWIQEGSGTWRDDTKSFDDEDEDDSSAAGSMIPADGGPKKPSTRRGGGTQSN